MRIFHNVEMLELKIDSPNGVVTFCPTLVWDDSSAILIDTGMPGQWNQIRAAMETVNVPLENLKGVILTHQDLDHIGSITEILMEKHDITIYAHELDQPYIEGKLPLIKTDISKVSQEVLESIPPEMRTIYENPPKAIVHHPVTDGEVLPYFGGIEIIFTPGHTPGHISLYLHQSKTLVAADAMVYYDKKLRGPIPQATLDMETATRSLEKFLEYDIDQIICYHGGLSRENIRESIKELI